MDVFSEVERIDGVRVQLFVVGKNDEYANFFTVIKEMSVSSDGMQKWIKKKGKNNFCLFECYMSSAEGRNFYHKIHAEQTCSVIYQETNIKISFGKLIDRPTVFMPNIPQNSVGRGWWPGSLEEGFQFSMLFGNREYEMTSKARENAFAFVKEKVAFNLNFLQDFVGSVIYLPDNEFQAVTFKFNPDSMYLIFALHGELASQERRVVIEAWEGEEALQSEMFDLAGDQFYCTWQLSFLPTKIGYRLYERVGAHWRVMKQHSAYLMREISINMGLTVGKLIVKKDDDTEEHDIVVRQEPSIIDATSTEQPWLKAERGRLKANKGVEIRQLGSLFLPYKGGISHQESLELINTELFDKATQRIWIWDPYLDESILDNLLILALRKRGLEIKLLLSEYRGERAPENECDLFPRCSAMQKYLEEQGDALKTLENFEIRNWFRAGKHTFHDRFIIIDNVVWSIGSSLKDIGNYHTTIYRLEGDLPDQVVAEFKKGWEGHFGHMEPNGLFVFPKWETVKKGERS